MYLLLLITFNIGFTEVVPTVEGEIEGRGSLHLTVTLSTSEIVAHKDGQRCEPF